jgi:hypothetical protein
MCINKLTYIANIYIKIYSFVTKFSMQLAIMGCIM